MALVLKQKEPYTWPIKITLPTDGGKRVTETFTGTFAWIKQSRIDELKRLAERAEVGRFSPDAEDAEDLTNISACREVLVGWSDVLDDDGDEVPFSSQAFNDLIEIPTVAGQIVTQWLQSLDSVKRKN
ncbi:MAG: hypothetical protein ACO3M2_12370 [Pseudohongiellaceae bacterium]|jgi:hypothetical protein